MSLTYKLLVKNIIKKMNIKQLYDIPEEKMIKILYEKYRIEDIPEFMYKDFKVKKILFEGRLIFKIEPKNGANENVIFFMHGGGGIMCATPLHFKTAAKLIKKTGAAMYMPFYPLAPESSMKESEDWTNKAYAKVLEEHSSENITVVGDSAGAMLSVSMCRSTDKKPKGIVLISPPVKGRDNRKKMLEMEDLDLVLSVKTQDIVKKLWVKESSAEFSMIGNDYSNFPPTQIYCGTNEIYYPYMDELAESITKYNVPLERTDGIGLCHDWVIIPILPEAKKAVGNICGFITR